MFLFPLISLFDSLIVLVLQFPQVCEFFTISPAVHFHVYPSVGGKELDRILALTVSHTRHPWLHSAWGSRICSYRGLGRSSESRTLYEGSCREHRFSAEKSWPCWTKTTECSSSQAASTPTSSGVL